MEQCLLNHKPAHCCCGPAVLPTTRCSACTPQAIVGGLVTKTLSSAGAGVYGGVNGQRVAAPPVAFDVFSVQVRGMGRSAQPSAPDSVFGCSCS